MSDDTFFSALDRHEPLQNIQSLFCESESDWKAGDHVIAAVKHGRIDILRWLVNDCGLSPRGALLIAAEVGHLEVVQWLLREGLSSIGEHNSQGSTALLLAAEGGHLETVQWLIKEGGASPQDRDNQSRTVLLRAAVQGHLQLVQWLILEGGSSPQEEDDEGNTALLSASANLEVVQWLIEKGGSSPAERDQLDRTVFLLAALDDDWEVVKWLLDEGWSSMEETDFHATCIPEFYPEQLLPRQEVFSVGWSLQRHCQFPRRYRMFCGVALWCLSVVRLLQQEDQAESPRWVFVVLPELAGLMFRFWHGEAFTPTQNC